MKIQFDPNQDYQNEAVKAITQVFRGQKKDDQISDYLPDENGQLIRLPSIANAISISDKILLENIQEIQKRNDLAISPSLEGRHFSVEMETGTGKTYIYLRTIYELNKQYNFKKFVIVVPSIAIREGVIKNLEITREHFQNLYNRVPADYYVYDSKRISILRDFASSDKIRILVINIDSFAKDINVINRPNDDSSGYKPIEFIQSTNPIVIVDEPQNMETEKRRKAIESLKFSCTRDILQRIQSIITLFIA